MKSLRTLMDALSDHDLTKHAEIIFTRTSKEEKITITFKSNGITSQKIDNEVDQWFKEDDEGND